MNPLIYEIRQWLADNPRHPDVDRRREQLAKLEKAEGIRSSIAREGQASVDEPRYETTRLRWMKPGPDGKLIPAGSAK